MLLAYWLVYSLFSVIESLPGRVLIKRVPAYWLLKVGVKVATVVSPPPPALEHPFSPSVRLPALPLLAALDGCAKAAPLLPQVDLVVV